MSRRNTLEEVQKRLDQIYGEGVWTIIHYEGNNKPCKLQHKCGEFKTLTLAKNIRNGKLLCACDPVPKGLQESYERNTVKKEDFQKEVDYIYGKSRWTGESKWTVTEFNGVSKPVIMTHMCGEPKRISRAINVRKGTCTCECELKTKC